MLKNTPELIFLSCGASRAAARPVLFKLVVILAVLVASFFPLNSSVLALGHGHFDTVLLAFNGSFHSSDLRHHPHHQDSSTAQASSEQCNSATENNTDAKYCMQACFAHCQIALISDFVVPDRPLSDKTMPFLVPDWRSFYPMLQKPPPRTFS